MYREILLQEYEVYDKLTSLINPQLSRGHFQFSFWVIYMPAVKATLATTDEYLDPQAFELETAPRGNFSKYVTPLILTSFVGNAHLA